MQRLVTFFNTIKPRQRQNITVALVIVTTMLVGAVIVVASRAATNSFTVESEEYIGSCTQKIADSSASENGALQFGDCNIDALAGLDITGATIPATNYSIPAGAIFLATNGNDANNGSQQAPFRTVNRAINAVGTGGTIVVRGGLYRDGYTNGPTYGIVNKQFTIQSYPNEQAWFDGTDIKAASAWTNAGGGRWYMDWSTPSFCQNNYYQYKYDAQPTSNTGPCTHFDMYADPDNPAAGDPQMVFINGSYAKEVTSLASATNGAFYYDWNARRMYISSDPSANTIEVAARPTFLVAGGSSSFGIQIKGLGFKRFATNEYSNQTGAAVTIYGGNTLIENTVFKEMAGQALYVGSKASKVTKNVFVKNGFNGVGSNGSSRQGPSVRDNLEVIGNYFGYNNTEKYGTDCTASCAQAGIKIAHMNGFTMKDNISEYNYGHGLWCDLDCKDGKYVRNIVRYNDRSGIIDEASSTPIIASNLIYNNKQTGIRPSSAGAKIYNNTFINNGGYADVWIYDDPRSYGVDGWTDVGPDTRNVSFVNNIISSTNSNLLRFQGTKPAPNTNPNEFFSLLNSNSYYRPNGTSQAIARVYKPGNTTDYRSVADLKQAMGFNENSTDITAGGDPYFVNQSGGDFRVRAGSSAYQSAATLPDDVAQALGLSQKTGYDRGAIGWPGRK